MKLTKERMYRAIVEKDTSFEGIFYTAVKTTGIFCRPSCTARKPKIENVDFFQTAKECILHGYRPCKICRPLQSVGKMPDDIWAVVQALHDDPALKLKDADLRSRNIEPSYIRRWFLKNHGITFHAYQRMFRINSAFKRITQGQGVADTAFDSGFDSLSGFGDSFKKIFGVSPKHSKTQTVVQLKRIETPLGTMIACASKQGICLLEFSDRKMLETELKTISVKLNAVIVQGDNPFFASLEQQLNEYFACQRQEFTIPLHLFGTPFQQQVWANLQKIPYGQVRSYKDQAIALEKTDSVRAVANANGMNRISILVPCHRVIGSNGQLTGYGGGLWRKQYLLALEKGQAALDAEFSSCLTV